MKNETITSGSLAQDRKSRINPTAGSKAERGSSNRRSRQKKQETPSDRKMMKETWDTSGIDGHPRGTFNIEWP
eukprot:CAMPEP_0206574856 /NCGR_PEP_ID=MMETSP0325_2-20121206/29713_1 /ASSEMBLY_ACC=CAM_ASM_000347 /TAXON_ID=2866 /ORGANISM="Crypthecodinium cohnii, Strain Seligo" /LENGTH=72 /DNA_ID=CAMNT_0054079577 /DNA_START=104 /DNA_END=320 /DNA_ORIENTATION=+